MVEKCSHQKVSLRLRSFFILTALLVSIYRITKSINRKPQICPKNLSTDFEDFSPAVLILSKKVLFSALLQWKQRGSNPWPLACEANAHPGWAMLPKYEFIILLKIIKCKGGIIFPGAAAPFQLYFHKDMQIDITHKTFMIRTLQNCRLYSI